MHLKIPHKFTQEEAVTKVKASLEAARPQMAGQVEMEQEEWAGNTLTFAFTAQKMHITGTLLVEEKEFVIDAKLPLMLRMFEGKIERTIMEQVKTLL
ncbi:MAG: polyhydroxyalkanoic acid system family protein [Candidatus Adlerbacteria bacterium]|nr:polyhydroxyalkanoic acid system family protein [Candidatus Adlerbacteria bacterium]